jgi:glyoxylase-like metal-dependent hydrolase (beta-lactamase superfamily II)
MASQSVKLGDATLVSLDAGVCYYDGGAMFGGVPKVIWDNLIPSDPKNRIPLTLSPLLILVDGRKIVVDTGFGGPHVEDDVKYFDFDPSVNVVTALAEQGVKPEDVDTVILTHLHSDHAAAATTKTEQGIAPTFPNARYIVHELEWEAALDPDRRSASAYRAEDFLPLQESGRLELVGDQADLGDGVSVIRTGGHTAGHIMVKVESGGQTAAYPADLIPSRYHVRVHYIAGIDLFPLEVIEEKRKLLEQAEREDWIVILDHDALGNIGRVTKDKRGRFVFKGV